MSRTILDPRSSIFDALRWGTHELATTETPRLEAEVLLAAVLGWTRARLYTWPETLLQPEQLAQYREWIQGRQAGEPLAYLLGHKEFYGLDFQVDGRVLIPRPETEILVEQTLKILATRIEPTLADVGTGSGAIALSVAVHNPSVQVWALDISPDALAVAGCNAVQLGVQERIRFCRSDLLQTLSERVDVIAANLPYLPEGRFPDLMPEVREHEPLLALVGGVDGLALYRRLLAQAPAFLKSGGALLCEIDPEQTEPMRALVEQHFSSVEVEVLTDNAGMERVILVHA